MKTSLTSRAGVNSSGVKSVMTRKPDLWCRVTKPNPRANLKLICFPYAGGSSVIFRSWYLHLPANVEVCALQLPGRQDRLLEPPFRRVPDATEEIGKSLLPILDRPFVFFGHSMG